MKIANSLLSLAALGSVLAVGSSYAQQPAAQVPQSAPVVGKAHE
jgi:hypothetical protein